MTHDHLLADAERIVVKSGLRLGLLTPAERGTVLALTWAAMPGTPCTEREVNVRLQAALAGPLACLDTDHVELRRWLVDAGWLQRDGYGRTYERAPLAAVPAAQAGIAAALSALDVHGWAAALRSQAHAARLQRHQAWLQAQGAERAATGAGAA